ncbi:hypothetical protein Ccrd_012682 [Cynara cardunculus var. scolymus]|uniref:Uncharacterized protein n=1 Tax=Cynara cardunculus var. scolymus TaxID=59895 RepID=A0A103YH12_CYNCS|nr:hypothetical protein Ccrd_012682 [Cynara cardunculus var. scolymus]
MAARPSLHFIASSINITKSSLSPSSTLLLRRIASATAPPQQHHHRKQKHKHIYPPQNPLPHPPTPSFNSLRPTLSLQETLAQKIGKAIRRPGAPSKARVYTDVNVIRPKEYWDYESLIYGEILLSVDGLLWFCFAHVSPECWFSSKVIHFVSFRPKKVISLSLAVHQFLRWKEVVEPVSVFLLA